MASVCDSRNANVRTRDEGTLHEPNAFLSFSSSSLHEKRAQAEVLTSFANPPKPARDMDSKLYNLVGKSIGWIGYAASSVVERCFRIGHWLLRDTKKLKKIESAERTLLETHFTELRKDSSQVMSGISKAVRFIPFIHAPISLVVDAVDKVQSENLNIVEKCAKASLAALSFVPRMVWKGGYFATGLLQKTSRYPVRYFKRLIDTPDRCQDQLCSAKDRIASSWYSFRRSFCGPKHIVPRKMLPKRRFEGDVDSPVDESLESSPYVATMRSIAENELQKSTLTPLERVLWQRATRRGLSCPLILPQRHIVQSDWEKLISILEEKIGANIVTEGALFRAAISLGATAQKAFHVAGKILAYPCQFLGKRRLVDLRVFTGLSLKSAELFFATEKGARWATAFFERFVPMQPVEAYLQNGVRSLIHLPLRLLAYVGIFQKHVNAVRSLPQLTFELKELSDKTSCAFSDLTDQWEQYCSTFHSQFGMCYPPTFQSLNQTTQAFFDWHKELFALRLAEVPQVPMELYQAVDAMREATENSEDYLNKLFAFFGDLQSRQKEALLSSQQQAIQEAYHEFAIIDALEEIRRISRESWLLHTAALLTESSLRVVIPLLHIQWLQHMMEMMLSLGSRFGATFFKYSLLGYDVNEKITATKRKLLLSAQEVSSEALTKADAFISQLQGSKESRWISTFKLLKFVVPASITLASGGTTTLSTKLLQIALPNILSAVDPRVVRYSCEYLGAHIPPWFDAGGTRLEQLFHLFGTKAQAWYNHIFHRLDVQREGALRALSVFERTALVELIEQSSHVPQQVRKIVLDKRLKEAFLNPESSWSTQDWEVYSRALLLSYGRIKKSEKVLLTPLFFLSLPEMMQERIRRLVPHESRSLEALVAAFNALPVAQKQKVHLLQSDEFQLFSYKQQKDLLSLLAVVQTSQRPYEAYLSYQRLETEELNQVLSQFSSLKDSDFARLTPSQIRRLPRIKLMHVLELLETYQRSSIDELRAYHEGVESWEKLKAELWDREKDKEELFDHIAILFSSLNTMEREQLLLLTPQEVSSMAANEQRSLLVSFQTHIEEWIEREKEKRIFAYSERGSVQPCLEFLNETIKKTSCLSREEVQKLIHFFNSTSTLFQSDCRVNFERESKVLTAHQIALVHKDIADIDGLYKSALQNFVKIKLSAGHFLNKALEIRKTFKEQLAKTRLPPQKGAEYRKEIELHHKAKEERLKEMGHYQVILNALEQKRQEKIRILECAQEAIQPLPTLCHEDMLSIIGIFSPLVEDLKRQECLLAEKSFEIGLEACSSLEERKAFIASALKEAERDLHTSEQASFGERVVDNTLSKEDSQLLEFYTKYLKNEIGLFIFSVNKAKMALLLERAKAQMA